MKECNYGRIPPCYGSLERAIYEEAKKVNDEWKKSRARHGKLIDKLRAKLMEGGFLDDTHDKVYGVNKQMCDIGKTFVDPLDPISEESAQEITKALEIIRNSKDIMKEKKTKKMTKAEAFEYFKGKKVKCYTGIANIFDEADKVEKFLKEVGCNYYFANHINWREWYHPLYGFLIDSDGDMYVVFENHRDSFKKSPLAPIEVSDILSIEIVGEKKYEEEEALDKISCLGAQIVDILLRMKGHHYVTITETTVALHGEGMSLFHSDPF